MIPYRLYLFDLDGTVVRGDAAIPGAPQAIQRLREQSCLVRFVTNNSSKTPQASAERLRRAGFEVKTSEMYTSAMAAARVLSGACHRALVVGEEGLVLALESVGIQVTEEDPQAVVVGIDRSFTYEKLSRAMRPLLDPGVRFLATNCDLTYPIENGGLIPGAGAIVAALSACSGREPEVLGKPNPLLLHMAMEDAGVLPTQTLVIGDRLETDIEAGRAAGCATLLVLSGVTHAAPPGVPAMPDVTGIS